MPDSTPIPEPSTALAKSEPATRGVAVRLGIAPTNIEEAWRVSQFMAKSRLVPETFHNKPEDVFVAVMMGAEVGLAPAAALASIAVINGRPALWGDGLLAVVMRSAAYADHDEWFEVNGTRVDGLTADDWRKPTTAAVCAFSRVGKPLPVTRRFTVAQAGVAGLLKKPGPWQSYPDRMLAQRARTYAARDCFPDVLRGLPIDDEIDHVPPAPVAATPRPVVRRLSDPPPAELEPDGIGAVPMTTDRLTLVPDDDDPEPPASA